MDSYSLKRSTGGFSAGTRVDVLGETEDGIEVRTRSPIAKYDDKGRLISSRHYTFTVEDMDDLVKHAFKGL